MLGWGMIVMAFVMAAFAYKGMAKKAYGKGLNEVAFGIVGVLAVIIAVACACIAGFAVDPTDPALSMIFFGGLFFFPMVALYLGAVVLVIKFCPADAGDAAIAIREHGTTANAQDLDRNKGAGE